MEKVLEHNQVLISGEIASKFEFSHKAYGENFYIAYLEVIRKSNAIDKIPVMFSERLVNVNEDLRGLTANVYGRYSSYNMHDGKRTRLILTVFATEVEIWENGLQSHENNVIYLEGTICKEPVYRETPSGRYITDLIIAVNRDYGKSDYIPCICWGRTAKFASTLQVGTICSVKGRIQSRNYTKVIDGQAIEKVAYEVSLSSLEVWK